MIHSSPLPYNYDGDQSLSMPIMNLHDEICLPTCLKTLRENFEGRHFFGSDRVIGQSGSVKYIAFWPLLTKRFIMFRVFFSVAVAKSNLHGSR